MKIKMVILNIYELDMTELTILDLTSDKYNALHWITILIQNRIFSIKNDIAREGKKYLDEHFSLEYENFDIIKGYRADNSYFTFAQAFLNNTISSQRLSEALKLGGLGEQIVIKSKKKHLIILNFLDKLRLMQKHIIHLEKKESKKLEMHF